MNELATVTGVSSILAFIYARVKNKKDNNLRKPKSGSVQKVKQVTQIKTYRKKEALP